MPPLRHFEPEPIWYNSHMTREQVKQILDRVLTWPAERQADAAHMLELMEEQDQSTVRLTDEQVAEVERRLADPNPKFLTLEEVRGRFARKRS
jgi:hypothetical protein